tara:strand:+ start:16 stop:396 length:381 start_codon:yes stop_codon:yes gene_type:complete
MLLERILLTFLAINLICKSFLKKIFTKFEVLFYRKKLNKNFLSKRQAFLVIKIIQKISKIIKLDSCLTRTLAYRNALDLAGCDSTVYIGVREGESELFSHCWIESCNIFNERTTDHSEFKVIKKIE